MVIHSTDMISPQNVPISAEVVKRALAPFLERWQKDFAEIFSSVLHEVMATAKPPAPTPLADARQEVLQAPSTPMEQERTDSHSADSPGRTAPTTLPPPPYGNRPWWDIYAYNVQIPTHGLHAGQQAPGTNIPNWVGLDAPTAAVEPSRIPKWDGNVPPGIPAGSVPFYSTNGSLSWLGADGRVWDTAGYVRDTVMVHNIGESRGLSAAQVTQTLREAITQAGRPFTMEEVWNLASSFQGEPQDPYPLYFESEGARREQAALALRNSPYGFGKGQLVPDTNLPAWLDTTATGRWRPPSPADIPAWDGSLPRGVPAGAVPFYDGSGALSFLGPNGQVYDPRGYVRDTVMTHTIAERMGISPRQVVSDAQAAVAAVKRPLTLGEINAGRATMGVSSMNIRA